MDVYVTRQFMIFFYSKFGGQKTCELILENMQLIFKNTGDDPYLLHIHISSAFQESTLLQNIEKNPKLYYSARAQFVISKSWRKLPIGLEYFMFILSGVTIDLGNWCYQWSWPRCFWLPLMLKLLLLQFLAGLWTSVFRFWLAPRLTCHFLMQFFWSAEKQ